MGKKSALQHFMEEMRTVNSIDVDEQTSRAFLGSFGLHGRTATIPVGMLSGGQKVRELARRAHCLLTFHRQVRLALALLVYPAPHLLVLDEVSTHLDMVRLGGSIVGPRTHLTYSPGHDNRADQSSTRFHWGYLAY